MPNKFLFAGAGTGKTERVVNESIASIRDGKRVLVLTYTTSNQREVHDRFVLRNRKTDTAFAVKGLYKFYLEDMIRPYQRAIFQYRIDGIHFNEGDPHKINGRTIKGRSEKIGKKYNPIYYLTNDQALAHSTYLAKLACAINNETNSAPIKRLAAIYDHIFFDECQDLVGWDYELLKQITKSKNICITCVGDFRQTIYQTATTSKTPGSSSEKINFLRQLGFDEESMNESHRSVQAICDFAATLHQSSEFPKIKSVAKIPTEVAQHIGVFVVKQSDVRNYIIKYRPVLLRPSVKSGIEYNDIPMQRINFGESKGLGFPRTLIFPTAAQLKFIQGDLKAFDQRKTEEAKNKFYVALTRAQFSVGIIVPDDLVTKCSIPTWESA